MANKGYLLVRVTLTDLALKARFDRWYADEHLPEAAIAFGAEHAQRFWSATDPAIHIALYRFPDLATARHATRPEIITPLVEAFDAAFPTGTTRVREYLELAGEYRP